MRLLVVLTVIAASQGPTPKEAQQGQAVTARDQRGTKQAPLIIKTDSAERAEEAAEHRQERLDKQATDGAVVRYAKYLFGATIILALCTIGLWAATYGLVRGAERTAKRQLRAYLHIHQLLPSGPISIVSFPAFRIAIKNFGQTPAYHLRVWSERVVDSVIGPTKLALPDKLTTGSKNTLGPGGELVHITDPYIPSSSDLTGMQANTHRFYLFGVIQYDDAFGEHRRETFRQSFNPSLVAMGIESEGNESTFEPILLSRRQRLARWLMDQA